MSTVVDSVGQGVEEALTVTGLRVDLRDRPAVNIVRDVSFGLRPGEIVGLIGETGSGKTTVASALVGHARSGAVISEGSVVVDGVDLLALGPRAVRRYRGKVVSYVPQDPGMALNPTMRVGTQLEETLAVHGVGDRHARRARVREILDEVRLPSDQRFLRRYPHELSGGQQQRVVIAIAFLCQPKVVVLDEPTTGLDVTTQAYVLRMVRELCRAHRTAGVYVSHDLAVVAGLADRIAVMYFGRLVEVGPTRALTDHAGHPYTRALIGVIPDPRRRSALRSIGGRVAPLQSRPTGCVFAERCELVEPACCTQEIEPVTIGSGHTTRCRRAEVVLSRPARGMELGLGVNGSVEQQDGYLAVRALVAGYGRIEVLHGVDIAVSRGIVTALVGESGSGKTTLARCIGGLHDEATGEISVGGEDLEFGARKRRAEERRMVQYIFQNASEALNPRKTIGHSIAEPLRTFGLCRKAADIAERVAELLDMVSLSPEFADRYPTQLSGGERQRVTIARALATSPSVLICDEITSALDVSVQASILLLIQRLCSESNLTILFVTHNLAVVRAIADRVAVLNDGQIVEEGPADRVLDSPADAYTKKLLEDTPTLGSH